MFLTIQKAKYGVAMDNAKDVVRKDAGFVTESNDNDGIAYFFDKIFDK